MRRILPILTLLLAWAGSAHANGLLIPADKTLPPLAMLNHKVAITIQDEVAATRVEQTFRNHTDRQLEATYIFPVPRGASVDKFSMWVNGNEVKGEMVEAGKAREIYTSIVRRTQDPGLLEYMGSDLLRLRVFPIPAHGDQKVALHYTYKAPRDAKLVEYTYPLKADGKATATLEDFGISATIKSQHAIQNVYSPTHAISIKRVSDHEISVQFDKSQGLLDKDFQLFYSLDDKDIGLTTLLHRPISTEAGYFMLLISPKTERAKAVAVPRDVVLILDTSGSMRGVKIEQARKALKYCLQNLMSKEPASSSGSQSSGDRFALINFATTVNTYKDGLTDATQEQIDHAAKWVDQLEATGGTAINDALLAALAMRSKDEGRTFTIIFFTDGQPTIGETNPEKILKNVAARNTASTRIFTFGVGYGDNINASMLDQLADQSRAVSTYVRPEEDIEAKVSGLVSKISHPVLANLKLTTTGDVRFSEIYPPQLPDLFHGGQLVVLGRYSGKGASALRLSGKLGTEEHEFVYETNFSDKTKDERDFVEHLWARRKVGYMLDQIRMNGEKKELVDEVVLLAKKYGITTPYTSYLIVPDGAVPVAGSGRPASPLSRGPVSTNFAPNLYSGNGGAFGGGGGMGGWGYGGYIPPALQTAAPGGAAMKTEDFARKAQKPGDLEKARGKLADENLGKSGGDAGAESKAQILSMKEAKDKKDLYDQARDQLRQNYYRETQAGKMGVELSVQMNNLRNQSQLDPSAVRNVVGRNCLELGGVWIDDGFNGKMKSVTVKAQSDAYFRILERQPRIKDVFQLGNHLVWVTPSGTALIVDTNDGKEKLGDAEIDVLFVTQK